MSGSAIPMYALIGVALAVWVIRDPVRSLFAFIVINVVLTLRPASAGPDGLPSAFDLLMGTSLTGIMGYWLIKVRIFERDQLSNSLGQLAMALFIVWSVLVTAYGIVENNNPFNIALRELLNLTPLFVLPIIYERYVNAGSIIESSIFVSIAIIAIVMIIHNVALVRSNLSHVVYLYQMGRGSTEATLAGLIVVLSVSAMMYTRIWYYQVGLAALFMLGWIGTLVSFSRSIYVATILGMLITLFLGSSNERKRGSLSVLSTLLTVALLLVPFYNNMRLLRLVLANYLHRFTSSQNVTTDPSLLNRFSEWNGVLQAIYDSPIFGYGFGGSFRYFQVISRFHGWTGFSHNSYLYIAFKTGVIGLLLILVAFGSYGGKAFHLLQRSTLTDYQRILVRACLAYICLFLIDAYFEPSFDSKTDLIWIGIIWGYFLSLLKQEKVQMDSHDFYLAKDS